MATHGSDDHPLIIGNIEIPCYVLEDSTRVITNRGLQRSLGMAISGGAQRMAGFLESLDAKGLDCKDLAAHINSPIEFQPTRGGRSAFGYEATVLADLCDVFLAARKKRLLSPAQEKFAESAEILVRGFARVGIIALVDEATGFKRDDAARELAKILEAFVAKEIQKWLKTFPAEFYELICEVRNEPLDRATKRAPYFGRLTNDLVYRRLAPGVLDELRKKNPVLESGNRKHKHFQLLTPDLGHPRLREHLAGVISVLKVARAQGTSWDEFVKILDKTHPPYKPMPLFDREE